MQYLIVGTVGIEPTCDRLLFLRLIRLGRYVPIYVVRLKGLEPPRLAAPDPKSGVATKLHHNRIFSNTEDVNPLGCSNPWRPPRLAFQTAPNNV